MTYVFSARSKRVLKTCDPRLQAIANEVIKHIDFAAVEGHRVKERQNYFFERGLTKLKFPHGKHNNSPSTALDADPYPIDYSNKLKAIARYYYFAAVFQTVATMMGYEVRWGGDWDGDKDFSDQSFDDLRHFEIVD